MDIQNELKKLGLKKSESKLYLYLLEKGASTPPNIAKGTGIARTNCYNLLRGLENKGMVQVQGAQKSKAYVARDPATLLTGLEQRMEAAKRIVPELRDFYTTQKNKPKIRFFSGWDEVKELYLLTLETEKLFAVGSTETIAKIDKKFLESYWHELASRKIIFDSVLMASAKSKTALEIKAVAGALRTDRFLPERFGDEPMDMFIWNDNIALIALSDPVFGTLITDAALVRVLKIMFGALWEELGRRNDN